MEDFKMFESLNILDNLYRDPLEQILLTLTAEDVAHLGRANKTLFQKTNSNVLWQKKLNNDFPDASSTLVENFRSAYIDTYKKKYSRFLPSRINFFSVVKNNDIFLLKKIIERPGIRFSIDDFYNEDADGFRVIDWAAWRFNVDSNNDPNKQIMLNIIYQKIKPFFLKSKEIKEIDVKKTDVKGNTLLHWAVICNQPEVEIEECIKQGCETESKNKDEDTPLALAAKYGNQVLLQFFIDKNAKYHFKNEGGLLGIAAGYAHEHIINFLLQLNEQNKFLNEGIFLEALAKSISLKGQENIINILIPHVIKIINSPTGRTIKIEERGYRWTVSQPNLLALAVWQNKLSVVKRLIELGAKSSQDALALAVMNNNIEMLEILSEFTTTKNVERLRKAFSYSLQNNENEKAAASITYLIMCPKKDCYNIDIGIFDSIGLGFFYSVIHQYQIPVKLLHLAIAFNREDIFECLIDIVIFDSIGYGSLGLFQSVIDQYQIPVDRRLRSGYRIDKYSIAGRVYYVAENFQLCNPTLLHLAIAFNREDIFEYLIEKGVSLDLTCPIVYSVCEWSSGETIEACTPLHCAVYLNNSTMVDLLLAKGANINLKTNKPSVFYNEKLTPIQLVKSYEGRRSEIQTILKDHITQLRLQEQKSLPARPTTIFSRFCRVLLDFFSRINFFLFCVPQKMESNPSKIPITDLYGDPRLRSSRSASSDVKVDGNQNNNNAIPRPSSSSFSETTSSETTPLIPRLGNSPYANR
jgi:ankyrin repeat protein